MLRSSLAAGLRLRDPRHLSAGAAAFVAAILVALMGLYARADAPTDPPPPRGTVAIRLLGVNDFHGHLEPPSPGVGGAAWLARHLETAELAGRTIRVHAGDMVGATPLVSAYFHDEPSIQVANEIGFDVGTLGNHEFDEGGEELLRLLRGGRRAGPEALKRDADGNLVNTSSPEFEGARFPYVAANTFDRDGELVLRPYRIVERAGVRLGFIGVTTPSTPQFLLERHSERFRFTDISDAVDRWVPELRRRGVEAIVVLAHSGAPAQDGDGNDASGEIVDEAREMSDAVDVVVAGHSHSRLNLRVPNRSGRGDKLVVEAESYGVAYDRVDLRVDRRTGEVVRKSAEVAPTPHSGVLANREVADLVARYVRRVGPVADRILGTASRPIGAADGLGEMAAEAQRRLAGADLAVVNPGSFRGSLDAGPVTYGEVFRTQAYDHPVLRMTMPGRDVLALTDTRGPSLFVAGLPREAVDPGATYSVAANELLATTSRHPAFRAAAPTGRRVGTEVEALAGYLAGRSGPL